MTRSGWLIHLTKDQRCLCKNSRFFHFQPEIISFSCPFTDTGKHRISAMMRCNIMYQLLNNDCLSYAGSAKQPGLSAFRVGLKKINNLDSSFEHFLFSNKLVETWRLSMNRIMRFRFNRRQPIDPHAKNIN